MGLRDVSRYRWAVGQLSGQADRALRNRDDVTS
jgi:hypothetical protein